jgi:hypothetical protein
MVNVNLFEFIYNPRILSSLAKSPPVGWEALAHAQSWKAPPSPLFLYEVSDTRIFWDVVDTRPRKGGERGRRRGTILISYF